MSAEEHTNLYWLIKDAIIEAFVWEIGTPEDHGLLRDAFMDVQKNGYFCKYAPGDA